MADKEHDQLAWRLASILQKLNQGEALNPIDLATEFNVHKRTIQRDLLERFAFLPLERKEGRYTLETHFLGRLTRSDIARFASLAGLNGLFPGLDTQFIRELFDNRLQDTFEIHPSSYEDLQDRLQDFRLLQTAISKRNQIRFRYRKAEGEKWVEVDPYRLINHAGIWYLAAADHGQAKAYAFGKISSPLLLEALYVADPSIETMLDREDSIWLNHKKTEVVLKIAPNVASYFRRRKLVPQQSTIKELADGGLIISGKVAHPDQILPIVRYWLPYLHIVTPDDWQAKLEHELQAYIKH